MSKTKIKLLRSKLKQKILAKTKLNLIPKNENLILRNKKH